MYFKRDTDYALRIMLCLAKAKKEEKSGLMLREISWETNIPMTAVRRILNIFIENEIVGFYEQHGRGNAFFLCKKMDEMSLMDILRVVEDNTDVLGNFDRETKVYKIYNDLLPYIESKIYQQLENITLDKILSDNQL